ncbi:PH domain-containing protein [Streptomyces sp. CB03234]|uniref:PH domain-containing protein n=1 Tax=Streptomyces sp. (strain CB03234) TaxID=1703937 RepID=UPI001A7E05C9|nr:PH domain-containing protein [Streptomyces sp. CB03234]
MDRRSARRRQRQDRRLRIADVAAGMRAPSEPLVWRAGGPGRVAAVGWCVLFVAFADRPAGGVLADPQPGTLFFAAWTSVVAAWVCCRLGMWRVTADRDGVHIRRFWAVRFLPWSVIGRVELRRDGFLEFVGPDTETMAGSFLPLWASRRFRRSSSGIQAADTLTVLSCHADLRPRAHAGRAVKGAAFADWALPLGVVLFAATEVVHR